MRPARDGAGRIFDCGVGTIAHNGVLLPYLSLRLLELHECRGLSGQVPTPQSKIGGWMCSDHPSGLLATRL